MKKITALMLVLCLILCGCGQSSGEEPAETSAGGNDTTSVTNEGQTAPVETTTVTTPEGEVVEVEVPAASLLTGEAGVQIDNRPIAIMINNHEQALPHCGISAAEVVYETQVEGGMTRFMAIFADPSEAETIGSVRSARPPYVSLVQAYDGIYCSASGMEVVLSAAQTQGVDYINALNYDGSYFYRDQARQSRGIAYEHTLFVKGADLKALAEKMELRLTRDPMWTSYGFQFNESAAFDGESANSIVIGFHSGAKDTTCYYDAEAGAYTLYQKGQDYIDGNTGEKVEFRNVLILEGESYPMNEGKHVYMETVGEGPGYYARDGKIVPITWSRESETSPYVYKTADGAVLNMGVGTTYIALIEDGSPVEYE